MPRRRMKSNFDHTKFLASSPMRMPDLGQYGDLPKNERSARRMAKKAAKKASKRSTR